MKNFNFETRRPLLRKRSALWGPALVLLLATGTLAPLKTADAAADQLVTFDNSQNPYALTIKYNKGKSDCVDTAPPDSVDLPAFMVTYVEFVDSNAAGHCSGGSKWVAWDLSTGPKNDAFTVRWWHYEPDDWVTQITLDSEAAEVIRLQNIKIEATCTTAVGDSSPQDCLNKDAPADGGRPAATIFIINNNK